MGGAARHPVAGSSLGHSAGRGWVAAPLAAGLLLGASVGGRRRRGAMPRKAGKADFAAEFGLPAKLAAVATALRSLPSDKLRYQQLLALAAKLKPMPEELKTPENKVPGCLSTVYVHAILEDDGTVTFLGDSDALISKGLVALLVNGLSGSTVEELKAVKPEFIQGTGITASLTPGRNNGFFNMFKLMNKQAADKTIKHRMIKHTSITNVCIYIYIYMYQ